MRSARRRVIEVVAVVAMAFGVTASKPPILVQACGRNCGIEMCPEDIGGWCAALGCYGPAACGPALNVCNWDTGILCSP